MHLSLVIETYARKYFLLYISFIMMDIIAESHSKEDPKIYEIRI